MTRRLVAGMFGALALSLMLAQAAYALPYPSTCDTCLAYLPPWACVGICGF